MKKLNLITLILFIIIVISCTSKKETDILWVSSNDKALWQIDTLKSLKENVSTKSTIKIFSDSLLQTVDGFGGCFNELGWEALNVLPKEEQQVILNDLFNPEKGCKFNICRMPIGANDYAVDWYSHNETDGDFEMKNFSIERDLQRLIPYIKSAKSINPNIKIWGSPWCPPTWMKSNKHYACRPDKVNDLSEEGRGQEMVSQFIMEDDYLNAYALYFSKYIQAYKKQGIDIYAVHVQNEPNSCQNFPSCVWNPQDLASFIGNYLGPKFQNDHLNTEIWLGTIERSQFDRVDTILQDENSSKYITGVGFQWAGKGAIPEVHRNYPNLKLMQTETECGNGSNDWEAAEYTFNLMKHYFKNGANSYLYWNMVLDETGKSKWGWKQNSMISIDRQTKKVTYNPEFYLMKHFSSYIKAGANNVQTDNENCLAFKNPKELVIIYYNSEDAKTVKEFIVNDIKFKSEIAPKSFNTFIVTM
ncbi:glycoside hydrolase family 30 protein [Aquimarina litoralis]|uniref:glycoside hydrolase family 30 protein n=1 Tax=Aquimarina litoralis TaxID=584605 RepID=UPI001C57DE6C|nr:hypothetical protein [Aquimarina litoralis]MBW1296306.1 hypothetical protein [Aquimarina litoralis]